MGSRLSYMPPVLQFKSLTPYVWPQDTLTVRNGFGSPGRVDKDNVRLKREFFGYCALINTTAVANSVATTVIPIDQSADFWCNDIAVQPFTIGAGALANNAVGIRIRDVSSSYTICDNPTSTMVFTRAGNPQLQAAGVAGLTIATQNPFQPYCFLRDSAIEVTLFNGGVGFATSYYVSFYGWKEYANASR